VTKIQDNDKGVWVIGNARSAGSFSATVRLFTDIKDIVGACAYASNYPPVAAYTADYNLKFTGTPMYKLVLVHERGGTMTLSSDSMLIRPDGYRLLSFTDATGAPGLLPRIVPPPTTAASKKVWISSNGAVVMSAHITLRPISCAMQTLLTHNASTPEYMIKDSVVIYNVICIRATTPELCPDPWRLVDVAALSLLPNWPYNVELRDWAVYGWYHYFDNVYKPTEQRLLYYMPDTDSYGVYYFQARAIAAASSRTSGYAVHCVYTP
jgi:hypothetical protein